MTPAQVANVAGIAASVALVGLPDLDAGAEEPDPSSLVLLQSWSPADRAWFHRASQGMQIMPYARLISLERLDSRDLLIPADRPSKTFPVGSRALDEDWIGFRSDIGLVLFDTTRPDTADRDQKGAVYGAEKLDDGKRRPRLEYLRTL